MRKAEFELLQSQINPHFLYNTLDAIVWLAEAGEQKKVVTLPHAGRPLLSGGRQREVRHRRTRL